MTPPEIEETKRTLIGLFGHCVGKWTPEQWDLFCIDLSRLNITTEQAAAAIEQHYRTQVKGYIAYPVLLCEFRKRHVETPKATTEREPTLDDRIAHLYHVAFRVHGLGHEKAAAMVCLAYGADANAFLAERQRIIDRVRAGKPKSPDQIVRETARAIAAAPKPKYRTYADLIRASHGSLGAKAPANAGTQRTAALTALEGEAR